MGVSEIFINEIITVEDLIRELELLDDKTLPVTLSAPSGYTDYFWITIKDGEVTLGTT